MDNILAKARKVSEQAEVFMVTSEGISVQFEANRLKHVQSKQSQSITLRIIRDGRIGYGSTTQLDDGQDIVDMAVETAQFGMPAQFDFPPLNFYPGIEVFDPAIESVSIEEMVNLGDTLITAITGYIPEIVCEAEATRGIISTRIINSCGGQAEYRQSAFGLSIEGNLIRDTDMLFVGESESYCHPLAQTKEIAELVIRQLELARNRASVAGGSLPVIFTPNGVASALVSPLMSAFNGKVVLEGASPVGNRSGEKVFDEKLSLLDDPTIPYRPESRPCDDEAVPSQRTALIDRGIVSGFFYDLQTAARAGTQSTGNGGRGAGGLPSPSPSAFIIAPGNVTFDEMLSDIKEGLVIEHLMGAQQGNVLGGDFSGNVLLGYKVENGRIVGRVKDTMVSGNIYQVLREISAVGSDTRWVGGFLRTPHLYCPALSVSSK